ncbi:MAG: MBL fold metallo-hydrolase [Firmicutes bacterium]|nr:MBL fold metallo-hydrolase [Bacillota bacterium]
MKIRFLGGARTVTGSFFVVEAENTTFAVDCGMFQGDELIKERNRADYTINPAAIDFLILTHAHIDHSGLIPKLCKAGFKGKIYCSAATKDLCEVMLPDSGSIQEFEAKTFSKETGESNQPAAKPIYTVDDAYRALDHFQVLELDQMQQPWQGVELRFREAGHILGSCLVELWVDERGKKTKLVFSGDLGRPAQPFVKDPANLDEADYLVIESTYGDDLHPEVADRPEELKKIIERTMKQGGNLIIPSFAVERTQDLLFDLTILISQDRLDPGISIYIDSPLAIAATEIFKKNITFYDQETKQLIREGHHPLKLPNLKYSSSRADSMKLNEVKTGAIIISASGMCDAGRIQYHLRNNLGRSESTILFVGYQAEGTLGRQIIDGAKSVELFGKQIEVKASIEKELSYSAHADQRELLNWIGNFKSKPKKVFVVHGEEAAQQTIAKLIQAELNIPVKIPDWLEAVEL